jgi:hypothetical protein
MSARTNEERNIPGNARETITAAEQLLPVRIRIGVPPGGLDERYTQMTAWLDENCGSDSWAMTPSGMRGVLNDAVSVYFADGSRLSSECSIGSRGTPLATERVERKLATILASDVANYSLLMGAGEGEHSPA